MKKDKRSATGRIVCDYLEQFTDAPTKTLARLIYAENSKAFRDLEHARKIILYYRGQSGDKKRKRLANTDFVKPAGNPCPFDSIPEGLTCYDDWSVVEIETDRMLTIADLHIPFHHRIALMVALDEGRKQKVDTILINGDGADFYQCSFWDRDPRKRNLADEIITTRGILSLIRQAFPDAKIYYKIGNHEERWERYLKVKAVEFHSLFANKDLNMLSYEAIFDAERLKINIVADKRLIKVGKLHIIHGHELYQTLTNPVNPSRGLFLKGKDIALCAHHHQTSEHTEPSMSGRVTSCWSIGCLCDLRPEYAPINKWNHGFAIIDNHNKDFRVHNKKIIQGRVY